MHALAEMPSQLNRWGWRAFAVVPIVLGLPVSLAVYLAGFSHPLTTTVGVCIVTAALTAAVTDALWQRIPNFITYTTFVWVLALNAVASIGAPAVTPTDSTFAVATASAAVPATNADELWTDAKWRQVVTSISLSNSLAGGVGCFVMMSLVYGLSEGGAGDVKIAAALGAGLGIERGLSMLIWTYLIAGTLMLVIVCMRTGPVLLVKTLLQYVFNLLLPRWSTPPSDEQRALMRTPVPLGPSFAIGMFVASLGGGLLEGRLT